MAITKGPSSVHSLNRNYTIAPKGRQYFISIIIVGGLDLSLSLLFEGSPVLVDEWGRHKLVINCWKQTYYLFSYTVLLSQFFSAGY